jgi:UDP-2-acetamido-3-amino-2,3-dideoxy-glucuronate N-acetyltransferase
VRGRACPPLIDLRMTETLSSPSNEAPYRLLKDVSFGEGAVVHPFTNLYGCEIGARTRIGPFVEVQRDVTVGPDCKVQSHTFICSGVRIGAEVFVGHGVTFINDKRPRATNEQGQLQTDDDWNRLETFVESGASVGSGAVILGGIRIGGGATVGAGAVVLHDVAAGDTVVGNPARFLARSRNYPSALA